MVSLNPNAPAFTPGQNMLTFNRFHHIMNPPMTSSIASGNSVNKELPLSSQVVPNFTSTSLQEKPKASQVLRGPSAFRVKSLNISDQRSGPNGTDVTQEIKSNVDSSILEELFGKEHLNIVFVGHVDSGKSTMGGHLLYLTGMVEQRTLEKYEQEARALGRESWYF